MPRTPRSSTDIPQRTTKSGSWSGAFAILRVRVRVRLRLRGLAHVKVGVGHDKNTLLMISSRFDQIVSHSRTCTCVITGFGVGEMAPKVHACRSNAKSKERHMGIELRLSACRDEHDDNSMPMTIAGE